ncbi:putative cis-zeatin O-glucosyltransferase [Panicum miliaceum]|uniref:Cis-zeatin O-glucosyltransferase n=1 Tax=Panicum miliaceum TaxID=4540 RepID=A0A3L6TU98_PANMI|nr:putative cis-zeatin O-glucosyltransferase [Panicum miliaceum]
MHSAKIKTLGSAKATLGKDFFKKIKKTGSRHHAAGHHHAAGSPFPSHLMPLWEAFTASAPAPVAALLREASASHRHVVVLPAVGALPAATRGRAAVAQPPAAALGRAPPS